MHIPKNNTAEGFAAHGLSLIIALGTLTVGLLAGIFRDGLRRLKPLERPEVARGNASKPIMKTLYGKP